MSRFGFQWISCLVIAWGLLPCRTGCAADEDAAQLIALIQSEASQSEKASACQRLAVMGSKEAVPALARLLSDEALACYGRAGLELIPDQSADRALLEAMGALKGDLLIGVINSIGGRRDENAVDGLVVMMKGPDGDVAAAAAEALGQIATPRSATSLVKALRSAKEDRRSAIAEGCLACADRMMAQGKLGPAKEICDALLDTELPKHQIIAAKRGMILACGSAGWPKLMDLFRSDDPAFQDLGLRLVGELPANEVAGIVLPKMTTLPGTVQVEILRALLDKGGLDVKEVSAIAGQSDLPEVRAAALQALGGIGDESSIDLLISAVTAQRSQEESSSGLGSLARLSASGADAALCRALASGEPGLRIQIIQILAERNATGAAADLLKLAGDPDAAVSEAAFEALISLAGPEDLPNLVTLLITCQESAQGAAVRAVISASMKITDVAQRARPLAAQLASASESRVRCALLRALAGIRNFEAFDAIRSALRDDDATVRDAALRALADWEDATPAGLLMDFAASTTDPTHRVLALRAVARMAGRVAADCERPSRQVMDWFARIHERVKTSDEKKLLLSGLSDCVDPAALDMALSLIQDAEVQSEAGLAVLNIASGLSVAGQSDAAKAAMEKVAEVVGDPGLRERAKEGLSKLEAFSGTITSWVVCGPFVAEGKTCQDLYSETFSPETPGGEAAWQRLSSAAGSDPQGRILLDPMFPGNHRVAYARTWITSPQEERARLEMGFDDGGKVWLNDQVVCEANTAGGLSQGSHKADVTLRKGSNLLFLKLTQHSGPWQFCVRLVGPDGAPLKGVRVETGSAQADPPPQEKPQVALRDQIDFGSIEAVSLFDGQSFEGWEGELSCFRIEDRSIVGGQLAQPIAQSAYLCSTREVGDFELNIQVRLIGSSTNGGVQFWSSRIPGSHELTGFQADLCDNAYWGCLYDGTRGRLLVVVPQPELAHIVRIGDWNEYRMRAVGDRVQLWLNGYQTVDWMETDPAMARRGIFGLQTHQGPAGEGWYRNILLKTHDPSEIKSDAPH